MSEQRRWIVFGLMSIVGLIFLARLFAIQVLSDEFRLKANDISIKTIIEYPHRGIILDRNGKELVVNEPVFDLMVIPKQVHLKSGDTLRLCKLLNIPLEDFQESWNKAVSYSKEKPSVILKQIYREELHRFQEKLVEFPGFYINSRTNRHYPHQNLAHVLGYVSEVDADFLERDTSKYYRGGDYIGRSGLEAAYEKELRGKKGVRYVWVDNWGREKGRFREGEYDTLARAGHNLRATIDLDLQKYGEALFQNKKGAVVAIEPQTGEILAMVSAPAYDPSLLTGRNFRSNYGNLLLNENKPLFNRAIRAMYPPGSTFKTVQALIGMQENVINAQSSFPCNKSLVKCHFHGAANLKYSIQYSCNPYYYRVFRRIIYQNTLMGSDSTFKARGDQDHRGGFIKWLGYLDKFNLGRKTGVDLVSEKKGLLPSLSLYDDRYGRDNWKFSNIYSLGIGQGEIGVIPLQLANVACILANRGHYYSPHLVKGIGASDQAYPKYQERHEVPINRKYFDLIIEGMRGAYSPFGTVASYAISPGLELCGKTGTAQNPHGEDHSVFIAFAPRDNPKIALAVYVENAGFGGVWAAPIAALMAERYLKGEISKKMEWTEKYVMDKRFILEAPIEPDSIPQPGTGQPDSSKNSQDLKIAAKLE